jgi:hypothetical protein
MFDNINKYNYFDKFVWDFLCFVSDDGATNNVDEEVNNFSRIWGRWPMGRICQNNNKNCEMKKKRIFFSRLTKGIFSCGHSLDDEDKQQLFVDCFCSYCWWEVEGFSSSVVVLAAGRHRGGGGNFFGRVIKLVDEKFDLNWSRSIFLILLIFFFWLSWKKKKKEN